MNNKQSIPKIIELDYRGQSFYDCEEDFTVKTCASFYKDHSTLSKRYEQLELIGSGGMKLIYRAYDNKTDRYVAIAKLNPELGREFYASFISEARLNASLEHPNIIKVHEIDFDNDEIPYFTMDLKQGDSLSDILMKLDSRDQDYVQKYSLHNLMIIFQKVCDAISYSHSQGVLHLDIKPENIQVGEFGEVLVCDWGTSKQTEEFDSLKKDSVLNHEFLKTATLHLEIKGTPGYMAPEQIVKNIDKCKATDIYALGALLYSILTKKRPLEGDIESILKKTISGEITPPLQRTPEAFIPQSLNAVVLKAMNTLPEKRYSSVNDLNADIGKYLEGYSTTAENAGVLKEISLFYQRNKTLFLSLCASFLIICGGLSAFIFHLQNARDKEVKLREGIEAAQKKSIAAEKEAKQSLEKYLREKKLGDIVSVGPHKLHSQYQKEFSEIRGLDLKPKMDNILTILNRSTETLQPTKYISDLRGQLYFIRQEFDLALNEIANSDCREWHDNVIILKSLQGISDYRSENKPAPLNIVEKAIKGLNRKLTFLQYRMVLYDGMFRENKKEHAEVIKYFFESINERWTGSNNFQYDHENDSLILSGDHLCNISVDNECISPLAGLKLKHLTINGPLYISFNQLKNLNLETLDISNSPSDLKGKLLEGNMTRKVILSPKQIKENSFSFDTAKIEYSVSK